MCTYMGMAVSMESARIEPQPSRRGKRLSIIAGRRLIRRRGDQIGPGGSRDPVITRGRSGNNAGTNGAVRSAGCARRYFFHEKAPEFYSGFKEFYSLKNSFLEGRRFSAGKERLLRVALIR